MQDDDVPPLFVPLSMLVQSAAGSILHKALYNTDKQISGKIARISTLIGQYCALSIGYALIITLWTLLIRIKNY